MLYIVRYIYSIEGITGLYRGLGMKIISNSVGNIVYNKVSQVRCASIFLSNKSFILIF